MSATDTDGSVAETFIADTAVWPKRRLLHRAGQNVCNRYCSVVETSEAEWQCGHMSKRLNEETNTCTKLNNQSSKLKQHWWIEIIKLELKLSIIFRKHNINLIFNNWKLILNSHVNAHFLVLLITHQEICTLYVIPTGTCLLKSIPIYNT